MKNERKKPIGLFIKSLADAKEIPAAVLAGKIGVSRGTVYELYKKHDISQIKKVDVIEDVLGLDKGSLYKYYYGDHGISEFYSNDAANDEVSVRQVVTANNASSTDDPFKEIAKNWKLMYENLLSENAHLRKANEFKDQLLDDFRSGAIKKYRGGLHPVFVAVNGK